MVSGIFLRLLLEMGNLILGTMTSFKIQDFDFTVKISFPAHKKADEPELNKTLRLSFSDMFSHSIDASW